MYAPVIAEQLRRRGHDVVAAREEPKLAHLPDPVLFAVAQSERQVVVTENVTDFLGIDARYREQGQDHAGLILTTNRKFPRGASGSIGLLVTALDGWLHDHPGEASYDSPIWWL